MKIIHLQHPFIPNRGYQENHLPSKQQQLGHEVHIVTTDVVPNKFNNQVGRFHPGTEVHNNVPVHRCRSVTYDTEAATLPIGAISKIRSLDPDVLHSHRLVSFNTICSLPLSVRSDVKIFYDLHIDNDNFHLDERYKMFGFSAFRKAILPIIKRTASGFIGVNPYAMQFLEERLGVASADFLPLGADTDVFYPSEPERDRQRRRLGVTEDEFLLITSGNLTPNKRVESILESLYYLDSDSIKLLILGDGPEEYLSLIKNRIDELNLDEKVLLHGFVDHDELSKFYNAADVGVWPGKLGITIIEAIACGLPVIVEDDLATDFLTTEDNGLALDTVSTESLADAISTYHLDDNLCKSHKKSAIRLTETTLSWESIAEESIDIYSNQ